MVRAVASPLGHRPHGVVDRGERHRREVARQREGEQCLVGEGPLGAEVAGAHHRFAQRVREPISPASARRIASASSGESSSSPSPSMICLQ